MLSEPRGRPALGCAVASMLSGFVILAFIGGWVVAATLIGWLT